MAHVPADRHVQGSERPSGRRSPADLRVRCPDCGGIKTRAHVDSRECLQPSTEIARALARKLVAAGFTKPDWMVIR